jgi:hypothetical protein
LALTPTILNLVAEARLPNGLLLAALCTTQCSPMGQKEHGTPMQTPPRSLQHVKWSNVMLRIG